jgi:hypothetical protein
MAKITGKGYRRGRVPARSQTDSRRRHTYTKRNTPKGGRWNPTPARQSAVRDPLG